MVIYVKVYLVSTTTLLERQYWAPHVFTCYRTHTQQGERDELGFSESEEADEKTGKEVIMGFI